jgi:hypothetical protein
MAVIAQQCFTALHAVQQDNGFAVEFVTIQGKRRGY